MERHILKLSLIIEIIEGATAKVSHLMKPLESIYDKKNFCFDEKMYFLNIPLRLNLLPLQSILSLIVTVSNYNKV